MNQRPIGRHLGTCCPAHDRLDIVERTDRGTVAGGSDERRDRLDLGAHGSRRKRHRGEGVGCGGGDEGRCRRSEIGQDAGDIGQDQEKVSSQRLGDEGGGAVLVDDRLDEVVGTVSAGNGNATSPARTTVCPASRRCDASTVAGTETGRGEATTRRQAFPSCATDQPNEATFRLAVDSSKEAPMNFVGVWKAGSSGSTMVELTSTATSLVRPPVRRAD